MEAKAKSKQQITRDWFESSLIDVITIQTTNDDGTPAAAGATDCLWWGFQHNDGYCVVIVITNLTFDFEEEI